MRGEWMDFLSILEHVSKSNEVIISPGFRAIRSKDLMTRGGVFYGIIDNKTNMWSTDQYVAIQLIDAELYEHYDKVKTENKTTPYTVHSLTNFESNSLTKFVNYNKTVADNFVTLDDKLTFANTVVKKSDHVSKRLPYDLAHGDISAWDEIVSTLYDDEERAKIEWAIGSIVAGDSRSIQKFIVFYGAPGTGKGTIIDIIQQLFAGYYTTFDAKELGNSSATFSTDVFRENPLVAIQHDGDLSKIEDNTKLNSIISHEEMSLKEKYKSSYTGRMNAFLFMGTNKPVKITDSKSGVIRRLIDVSPSRRKIPTKHYHILASRVKFETGAIAQHCLDVYRNMGKDYYSGYVPQSMMEKTDAFYNFVEENYWIFKKQDGVDLKQSYAMYKEYCDEASLPYIMKKHDFKEELKSYFDEFSKDTTHDGERKRNYYYGFKHLIFRSEDVVTEIEHALSLSLDETVSLLDEYCKDLPAQYGWEAETPSTAWDKCNTTLSQIDTSKLHYINLPVNHIVIDFDLKDDDGNKSLELNLEAASKWPPTYAEVSKGGEGIHLHYIYEGDAEKLVRLYDADIEVKVFVGKSALRRKLSRCNNIEIAKINSGLEVKGDNVINQGSVKNERHLRVLIEKALRKEIHAGTKSNIDYIKFILDSAYESGIPYDVTDMMHAVLDLASSSSNQAEYCIHLLNEMKFKSEIPSEGTNGSGEEELVSFDVEVFPNLFIIVWKFIDRGECVVMINPTPEEVGQLFDYGLIGFNNRRYDNHILYGRYLGLSIFELYKLSKSIINNERNRMYGEAYNLSHTDIYDYSTKKQSLKQWEIDLGINHMEMIPRWEIPEGMDVWDVPVPEEHWDYVVDYCKNDVLATESVFHATEADYIARLILAELSGLTANDTTQKLTARIIFGNDKRPQNKFVYPDLSKTFPGYTFERGKSMYRDIDPGEGGYVYSKPGIYGNVWLFDIASQHPTSAVVMNIFGDEYTANYKSLMDSRLSIKHDDIEDAETRLSNLLASTRGLTVDEGREMINTILDKYNINIEKLAYTLKIPINIVYGMTAAKFDNPFKDTRNVDNVLAKRGALFMIDLQKACEKKGYNVVHIKTDSIKIADCTNEIKDFIFDFGKKYEYTFEHEASYDKICLVNKSVYVAKYSWAEKEYKIGTWETTGAQFAHPYIKKTLFTGEQLVFDDYAEAKAVKTKMYLDLNEDLECDELFELEKQLKKINTAINKAYKVSAGEKGFMSPMKLLSAEAERNDIIELIKPYHLYVAVGKVGSFVPVIKGGGTLVRSSDTGYHAVAGTKKYRWAEASNVKLGVWKELIDNNYYIDLTDKAIRAIESYGDYHWFVSDQDYNTTQNGIWPF